MLAFGFGVLFGLLIGSIIAYLAVWATESIMNRKLKKYAKTLSEQDFKKFMLFYWDKDN